MPTHHVTFGNLVGGGAEVAIASEANQFLERAQALHAGLEALAPLGAERTQAAVFLASWSLELGLKSYLALKGKTKDELKKIGHNLTLLWTEASNCGLSVPNSPPRWCVLVSETHKSPFHQRYPTDKAVSIYPNIETLLTELTALLVLVRQSIS